MKTIKGFIIKSAINFSARIKKVFENGAFLVGIILFVWLMLCATGGIVIFQIKSSSAALKAKKNDVQEEIVQPVNPGKGKPEIFARGQEYFIKGRSQQIPTLFILPKIFLCATIKIQSNINYQENGESTGSMIRQQPLKVTP